MKITKIHLKNWHQFQDLELDFTYPEGHEKAGQPLKKVCFIGPNGVGKTKLLNLIANFGKDGIENHYDTETNEIGVFYEVDIIERGIIKNYRDISEGEILESWIHTFKYKDKTYHNKSKENNDPAWIFANSKVIVDEFAGTRSFDSNRVEKKIDLSNLKSKILFVDQLSDFKGEIKSLGTTVDVEIPDYVIQTSKLEVETKLGKLGYGMIADRTIANIRIKEALEESKSGDFDKLKLVFNEITDGLITLDRVISESKNGFKTTDLVFKTQNGEEIHRFDLSSGVEQIFYRLLFVASFNLKESIVLVDEPEISLFPDKQKKIVGWYTKYCDLSDSNQFFFATHSPLVMTQFEPEEIFVLNFDENGKVFVDRPNLGSLGYSSDEALGYWFGVDSRSDIYYKKLGRYDTLRDKESLNKMEKQEFEEIQSWIEKNKIIL